MNRAQLAFTSMDCNTPLSAEAVLRKNDPLIFNARNKTCTKQRSFTIVSGSSDIVIIACSVLHNIAIDRNQPLDDKDIDMEDDHDEIIPPAVPQNGGVNLNEAFIRRQGFAKRARITQHSF
ncbi:hypothetical protein OUZ56_025474 [Daphnia magna]|uniref:DDE Tnp4 domain-containing protein n=1 Tax=Daphnia magna TaxID=35525 RepID=A0ABQ9ZKY6_9CRUS|nr:hypothetical protein OUZ56_025474 [Daphnia magna]